MSWNTKRNCVELKCRQTQMIMFPFSVLLALLFFSQAIAQPGNCATWHWKPESCWNEKRTLLKRYTSEINDFNDRIKQQPKNAELYYQRGKVFSRIMTFETDGEKTIEFEGKLYFADVDIKAIADFTRAINLLPKPDYFEERGNIYLRYWKLEAGEATILSIPTGKTNEQILQTIDDLFLNNLNFNSAKSDFLKAIELDPTFQRSERAYQAMADMRWSRAHWLSYYAELIGNTVLVDVALTDFDFLLEYQRFHTAKYKGSVFCIQSHLIEKAIAAKKFGRDDVALKTFDEAEKLEKKGDFPTCKIYSNRAEIYLKQQEYNLAIKDLSYSIKNNPGCKHLMELRGDVYLRQGDIAIAIENYSGILDDENRPSLWRNIQLKRGKLYLQIGDGEKAIADFTKIINDGTLCEKDFLFRAQAYRLVGNEQAAQDDEKRATETLQRQKNYVQSDFCYYHQQ